MRREAILVVAPFAVLGAASAVVGGSATVGVWGGPLGFCIFLIAQTFCLGLFGAITMALAPRVGGAWISLAAGALAGVMSYPVMAGVWLALMNWKILPASEGLHAEAAVFVFILKDRFLRFYWLFLPLCGYAGVLAHLWRSRWLRRQSAVDVF